MRQHQLARFLICIARSLAVVHVCLDFGAQIFQYLATLLSLLELLTLGLHGQHVIQLALQIVHELQLLLSALLHLLVGLLVRELQLVEASAELLEAR